MNRHIKYKIGALSLSTLLLLTACNSNEQQGASDALTVEVSEAHQQLITKGTVYSGVIQPNQQVAIMPKISGEVVDVPFEVGDKVKKGDILLSLDDKALKDALKSAKAASAAASANVTSAQSGVESKIVQSKSGVVSAKNGVVQAQTNLLTAKNAVTQAKTAVSVAENAIKETKVALEAAKTAKSNAQENYDRMKTLYGSSLVSKAELEQSQLALDNAKASYDSKKIASENAVSKLNSAKKELATAEETLKKASEAYQNTTEGYQNAQEQVEIAQDTATVEASKEALNQANVQVEIAQDNLNDAQLKSPINGVISKVNTDIGERVSAQTAVLEIVDLETVKVLTYVPATEINNIAVGDKVNVKGVSVDSEKLGKVKTISPADDNGKGYPVEIEVQNADLLFKSGMLVDIQFVDEDAKQAYLLPKTAVHEDEEGNSFVFVAEKDHAVRKEVKASERIGSKVVVTSGLKDGDLVITDNIPDINNDTIITYENK